MKKYLSLLLVFTMLFSVLTGCSNSSENIDSEVTADTTINTSNEEDVSEGIVIKVSDTEILVDGVAATERKTDAVYKANDIIYYEEGKDFTYGEGTEDDFSSKELADSHTVVHVTQPGTYILTGEMSNGQIAVDLGEDAKNNPNAVVTLVLNQLQMTCRVAPAIIFYNVYECGIEGNNTEVVDTSNAGANIVISDDTFNIINGSYVSKIYEPNTVKLSADGTKVEDAETLHKYDGAINSKMSMNIDCGSFGSGILVINAENEGLCSDYHLTINGGCIQIESNEDGINASKDKESVITINNGTVSSLVHYMEGDGIDSNGWVVINGGTVLAQASSYSMDSGIDSDNGLIINGGKIIATGNMLDKISEGTQNYAVFSFAETQKSGNYMFRINDTKQGSEAVDILSYNVTNDFNTMLVSNSLLSEGEYTLWAGETQLKGAKTNAFGMSGQTPPEKPEGNNPPEGGNFNPNPPEGGFVGGNPGAGEGFGRGPGGNGQMDFADLEVSEIFTITNGSNYFVNISAIQ